LDSSITGYFRRGNLIQPSFGSTTYYWRTAMSVFLVADIKITSDAWVPEYAANVHKFVERQGGRYLSRSGNITTLEGPQKDSNLVAIMQFPSKSAVEAFVNDPEYQPYIKARQAGSVSKFFMIDDTDIAGTVPYLKAG